MEVKRQHVLALSGGVGGAKLGLGLAHVLGPDELTIIANTGDDFEHLGVTICPDIDTLIYTLSGEVNLETGWGMREESWNMMAELKRRGLPAWFNLGDRDMVTHFQRTASLRDGVSLTDVTAILCSQFGVGTEILPMSDAPVRTRVLTPDSVLDFQEYFVKHQCRPVVRGFEYEGADDAPANARALELLESGSISAIVICPSNPFVSVAPILSIRPLLRALRSCSAPIIAVSPIVGGRALKGPAGQMLEQLGRSVTPSGVLDYYRSTFGDLIDGYVLDSGDASFADTPGVDIEVLVTNTVMKTDDDKSELARQVLKFAATITNASGTDS